MGDDPTHIVYTGSSEPEFASESAIVFHLPMLEARCEDIETTELRAQMEQSEATLVFYSRNAVRCAAETGVFEDVPTLSLHCWAVGRKTAELLNEVLGCEVFVPEDENFEGLIETIVPTVPTDGKIFSFELVDTPRNLAEALRGTDVDVVTIPTYETIPRAYDDLLGTISALRPDWLVFTSPRGFESFVDQIPEETLVSGEEGYLLGTDAIPTRLAAIGPTTSGAMTELGYEPDLVPTQPNINLLLREITG